MFGGAERNIEFGRERMSKQTYLRSVGHTYLTQMVALPLGLVAAVLQARLIGPEGVGQVSYVTTTVALGVLYLGFGLTSSISFHVASGAVRPRALLRPLGVLLMVIVVSVGSVVAALIAHGESRFVVGSLSPGFGAPALVVLFTMTMANAWLTSSIAGRKDFRLINVASVVAVVIPVVGYASALVGHRPRNPAAYAIGCLVVAEIARAALLASGARGSSATSDVARATASVPVRAMLSYSLFAYACNAIQFLTYRLDVWIVHYCRGDAELGQYSLAVGFAELVWLPATSFATVLFPHVSGVDKETGVHLSARAGAFSVLASAVLGLLGYLVAIPLVPLLFSAAFRPSIPLLGILLFGTVPFSAAKVLGSHFAGTGALRLSLMASIVDMTICVGLDFLLIPRYGARGAAVATAIAYSACALTVVVLFRLQAEVPFKRLLRYAVSSVRDGAPRRDPAPTTSAR